jgi:chemotaxis protein CheX
MVRGAFQQAKVANAEIVHAKSASEITAAVDDDCVVLVDWEADPAICSSFVTAAKKKSEKAPVLLLCAKAKAGTAFAGMKVGAAGIINKPIDPDDLIKSITNAMKKTQTKKPNVNVEFINPFIDATRNVFSTMCGIDIERKKLFLKDDHKMLGDVSGVMGMSGSAHGSVVISLPEKLACYVVAKMLGEAPADKLNPEVCDGVGEVINMIAGQAKASLVKTKYHFNISIPSVVSGTGHEITHRKGTPNIVVLFEAEGQDFAIQVCLAPTEEE